MSKQDILNKINIMDDKLVNIEEMIRNLSGQIKNIDKERCSSSKSKVGTSKSKETPSKEIVPKGTVSITKYSNVILITGDTFDKKKIIKNEGGYWSPQYKGWITKKNQSSVILKTNLEKLCETVEMFEKSEDLVIDNTRKTILLNNQLKNEELDSYGFMSDDD